VSASMATAEMRLKSMISRRVNFTGIGVFLGWSVRFWRRDRKPACGVSSVAFAAFAALASAFGEWIGLGGGLGYWFWFRGHGGAGVGGEIISGLSPE
jgi:hypothetical protein